MISHYFNLARKILIKNKYYTFINVVGLVCGMLSALIIAKYVGCSLQFDSFHLKKDRIYSISQEEFLDGNAQKNRNATYWGVGELVNQFPEVASVTRIGYHVESLVIAESEKGNRVSFIENKISIADSNFLKIFTFPLLLGNPETALSRNNSLVLTKSASQRYFGNANPIGKTLTLRVSWGKETMYVVTGVMEDIPKLSRFRFEFLVTPQPPMSTDEIWSFPDVSIYTLLKENAAPADLAKKLTNTLKEVEQLKAANKKVTMSLESIANVQLSTTEYLLAAVGVFIVLICWVNYINPIIAQSYWRTKEIGMLRVMGASKANLRTQFIIESFLICLTSLIVIIGLYVSLEQPLQSLTNGHLLPLMGDPSPINLIFLVIFIIGVAFASAVPTAILFSQNFGTTLRNLHSTKIGSIGLRKALVVFQFSISTVLMISIFVISSQLEYLKTKNKGVNMDNVLVVKAPMVKDTTWNAKRKTLEIFKEKCAELPFVTDVTSSTTVPGEEYRHETYLSFMDKNDKSLVHQSGVDDRFFNFYNVEFIAGRDFIRDARSENSNSIILNESAARGLGIYDFDKMIDTKIVDHESNEVYDLIGIIKDYHQTTLKHDIEPIAFKFNVMRGHISMKINKAGLSNDEFEKKLGSIKQIWGQDYNDAFFDAFFLDEKYEAENMEDRYRHGYHE